MTERVPDTDRAAGIVSRGIAAAIDTLLVVLILIGGYLAIVVVRLMIQVRDFAFPSIHLVFTTTGFIVVATVYLAACWAVSGRTVGSVIMGLRVTNRHGQRLRPSVALGRAVLCVLLAVGLLLCAVDPQRRSLADVLMGSRVIYSR